MSDAKEALKALKKLVTPYDSNDELGLQMYGYYLHEYKEEIRIALEHAAIMGDACTREDQAVSKDALYSSPANLRRSLHISELSDEQLDAISKSEIPKGAYEVDGLVKALEFYAARHNNEGADDNVAREALAQYRNEDISAAISWIRTYLSGGSVAAEDLDPAVEAVIQAAQETDKLRKDNYDLVWKLKEQKKCENVIEDLQVNNNKLRSRIQELETSLKWYKDMSDKEWGK